jgi:truncated hemoglobin YjbI
VSTSLYDEMGGEAGLRRVLQALYDRLFDDPMIGFFFAGKNKAELIEHQLWFTARFLGGPSRYEGRSLPDAHAPLPILPAHFDRRHTILKEVLDAESVPQAVEDEWLRVDQSLKHAIVKSGEEARRLGRTAR